MSLGTADVALWRSWIGRSEDRSERLDREALRRFAAALGEDVDIDRKPPSLAHWAFFLPVVPSSETGPDGHPKRGGFLPPISLPRRMFASARMAFHQPLLLDELAERRSLILDVTHKVGKSGNLVLVEVEHRITQRGSLRVLEHQTIAYRGEGSPSPTVVPGASTDGASEEVWMPGEVDLFRFSAATFNGHRIHYDLPYATGGEGYPALVVQGPFTAARLFGLAARDAKPTSFAFRAVAPLFVGQPIRLTVGKTPGEVAAVRCDGAVAMTAAAEFAPISAEG
jgi:3-methylfumaryl-CoA hydratase